jgi:hypothetical protein
MKHLTTLIVLIVFLFSSNLTSTEFKFTYNPPDGVVYNVINKTKKTEKADSENPKTEESIVEYQVTISKVEEGFASYEIPISYEKYVDGQKIDNPLIDMIMDFTIETVIDSNGHLIGLSGYEGLIDSIMSNFTPEIAEKVSSLISEEILIGQLLHEWNSRIADFTGKDAKIGDVWQSSDSMLISVESTPFNFTTETKFKEMINLDGIECIRIEFNYIADSEEYKKSMESFFSNMMGMALDSSTNILITEAEFSGYGERIIDPSTMLIYSEKTHKTFEFSIDAGEEGIHSFVKNEIEEYSFDYIDDRVEIWIGQIHVKPQPGCDYFDEDVIGGRANVVCLRLNEEEFRDWVNERFENAGLTVVSLENVEPLRTRIQREDVSDNILESADYAKRDGDMYFDEWKVY